MVKLNLKRQNPGLYTAIINREISVVIRQGNDSRWSSYVGWPVNSMVYGFKSKADAVAFAKGRLEKYLEKQKN